MVFQLGMALDFPFGDWWEIIPRSAGSKRVAVSQWDNSGVAGSAYPQSVVVTADIAGVSEQLASI